MGITKITRFFFLGQISFISEENANCEIPFKLRLSDDNKNFRMLLQHNIIVLKDRIIILNKYIGLSAEHRIKDKCSAF